MTYDDNKLTLPEFINFSNIGRLISVASANFSRNILNNNIIITVPLGIPITTVYTSSDVYLPTTFNEKIETAAVQYTNNKDAFIQQQVTCLHAINIQFKLTKINSTNFSNKRGITFTLVNANGVSYNAIVTNYQPDTGQHVTAMIVSNILQTPGDIVKIKINVVQNSGLNDYSDTLLTIFNISWNIESLKNF